MKIEIREDGKLKATKTATSLKNFEEAFAWVRQTAKRLKLEGYTVKFAFEGDTDKAKLADSEPFKLIR